jgi:predicted O-methyltransferase YrrM
LDGDVVRDLWATVDGYFEDLLTPNDAALEDALVANQQSGLPPHDVSRLQGRFLELLVRIARAKRVLEIGTLGGYSTIWLARAVGDGGRVITLEVNAKNAGVARANLAMAGVIDKVDLRVGRAAELLPLLASENTGPFDLIFIDADKPSNPEYLSWSLRLSRPGTVIVGDNVVREGKVIDAGSHDGNVQGVRKFAEMIAQEPRLRATALQTVGSKGYDGFVLAVVI